jgi:hypothetical protein
MRSSRQFSLRQLLAAMTAVAFAIGLPITFVSSSSVVVIMQLLVCLPVIGAALGSTCGRLREGAILGACVWEAGLVFALILLG